MAALSFSVKDGPSHHAIAPLCFEAVNRDGERGMNAMTARIGLAAMTVALGMAGNAAAEVATLSPTALSPTIVASLDAASLGAAYAPFAEREEATVPPGGKGARLAPPEAARKRPRLERRWRYERNEYSALIERFAAENDVPAEFAHAIVEIESRFRPNVRGRAGEIGLMQIKPATARLMGFRGPAKALFDPETNIKYGMKYLAKARRLGDQSVCGTILKYNAGHAARRMNRISRAYCEKVKGVLARNAERYELESITRYAFLDAPRPRFRALD